MPRLGGHVGIVGGTRPWISASLGACLASISLPLFYFCVQIPACPGFSHWVSPLVHVHGLHPCSLSPQRLVLHLVLLALLALVSEDFGCLVCHLAAFFFVPKRMTLIMCTCSIASRINCVSSKVVISDHLMSLNLGWEDCARQPGYSPVSC